MPNEKSFRVDVCALIVLLSFSSVGYANDENRPLLIVVDPWPPYVIGNEGELATGGIFVEKAREIFDQIGLPYEIRLFPWKRCLQMIQDGNADFILGMTFNEDRLSYVSYPKTPLFTDVAKIFYLKENYPDGLVWKEFSDLNKKSVGVIDEYNYGLKWKQAVSDDIVKIDPAKNENVGFKKMVRGRYDMFLAYEQAGLYMIQNTDEYKNIIDVSDTVVDSFEFFIVASNASQRAIDLLPKIDEFSK